MGHRFDSGLAVPQRTAIRRAILARLSAGEASVNDLAAPFAMSLPAVSKHLKVLEDAGARRRRAPNTSRGSLSNGVQQQQVFVGGQIKQGHGSVVAPEQARLQLL